MNYKNRLLFAVLGLILVTSCTDDLEPDYPAQEAKPFLSFGSNNPDMVYEGEEITVDLTFSQAMTVSSVYQLEVLETSTATIDEDFELNLDGVDLDWGVSNSYVLTVPAYASSTSFTFSAILDELNYEDAEVVNFKLTPNGNFNGDVEPNPIYFSVTINNRNDTPVDLVLDWNTSFTYGGQTWTLCDIQYDNDFILADSDYNLYDYLAATSDCPEIGQIVPSDLGFETTWHIYQNVYDDAGLSMAGITPAFSIPVTVNYSRDNSTLNGSYVQSSTYAVDSDFGSDPNMTNLIYLVSFTIEVDGTVTFFNDDSGEVIASGRNASGILKGFENLPKRIK